jgi:hypothetical protein
MGSWPCDWLVLIMSTRKDVQHTAKTKETLETCYRLTIVRQRSGRRSGGKTVLQSMSVRRDALDPSQALRDPLLPLADLVLEPLDTLS